MRLYVYPVCHTLELGEAYESMPLLVIPPGKRIYATWGCKVAADQAPQLHGIMYPGPEGDG